MTKIRSLEIWFESGKLSDSNMQALGLEISRNLIHLTHLSLSIYIWAHTETNEGLEFFLSAINKHTTNLKSLELRFIHDYIDSNITYGLDQVFGAFTKNMDRNLSSLRQVKIAVPYYGGLADEALETFATKARKHLINLQSISLSLAKSRFDGPRVEKIKKALHFIPYIEIKTI